MASIKTVVDKDSNQFLPITHERAVRDDNGTTLETKLQALEGASLVEKSASTGTTGDYPYNGLGRVVLQKNMVSGVNTLTQAMMSAANTVYVIQYDFVLGEDITIPANCVLEFDGGSISGAYTLTGTNTGIQARLVKIFNINVILVGSFISDSIYPEWFGAIGDGTTIDDIPFSKMADFINNNANGLINLKFGHKHYKFNSGIQIKKDIVINGEGVTLEYTVDTSITETYWGILISKDNPLVTLNAGTVSAIKDTNIVTTSNSVDLAIGDYFVIEDTSDYSWTPSEKNYHAGDIFRVKSISGNTITVTENVSQDYNNSNIVLRKLNTIKAVVSDINFICHHYGTDRTSNGVVIVCGIDSVLQNLRGEGSFHAHFDVEFCYGASIQNCYVDTETPICGLNYGAFIGSSKHVTISDCFLKTSRHGLSTGGGAFTIEFVNRYITITNCIFDTYGTYASLDTHQNGEYILVDNCIIRGGFSVGTLKTTVQNCEIFSRRGSGYGIMTHRTCRDITIKGNVFRFENDDYTGSDATLVQILTPVVDNTDTITISHNVFYAKPCTNANSYGGCVNIKDGTKFHNITIENNKFYKSSDNIEDVVSIMLRNLTANKISIKGNFSNTYRFINTYQLSNDIDVSFIGNYIDATIGINCMGLKCVDVIGNIISNTDSVAISIRNPNNAANYNDKIVKVTNNTLINCNRVNVPNNNFAYEITYVKNAIVTNNTDINDGKSAMTIKKYSFDYVDKIIFQNNKFWYNGDLRAGVYTGTPSSIIAEDAVNAGSTRPTNVEVGFMFFDTNNSMKKPIWWNGTAWVDATGTTV